MTPPPVIAVRRGDSGLAVADICYRLAVTGDLTSASVTGSASPRTESPRSTPTRSEPRALVEADAVFDERVENAVKSFQQRRGLLVDGVVGRSTYAVLDGARWSLGDRVLRHLPGHLVEGDDVAALQNRLVELGFTPGKVDGIHGLLTDRAVRAFQTGVGLDADGTVGPATMRAFVGLRRSVGGGSANALRERESIRHGGISLSGRTIVLDPGHGGTDPGAVGRGGLVEADLSLDLAQRIEGRLSAHGVSVVFTRTSSTEGGSSERRAEFANQCDADLVLSLHTEHSRSAVAHGVSTYFYGHTDATSEAGEAGPVSHGGWSVTGEHFADLLLREVVARTGLTDCRTHPRTWAMLRRTRMPAVHLDVGYLDHEGDAAALADENTLDHIAEEVVVALQRLYLGDTDTTRTGVLRLDDLRRHLEMMRATRERAASAHAGAPLRTSIAGS
ncbi:MAG: N-acetylmuramoyl-L-alanine amidase [Terracoccus sp.]